LREPLRGAMEVPTDGSSLEETAAAPAVAAHALDAGGAGQSTLRTVGRILSTRDWLISTAGYTALTAALGSLATWATVVMARDQGMDETSAAVTLGLITLLGGAAGTFGGGWIADRVAARRHNAYFLVCAVSTLVAVVPTVAVLIVKDAAVYVPCNFIS